MTVDQTAATPPPVGTPVPPPARTGATSGLLRAGARGAAWLGMSQVLSKLTVALTTIVLARLLAPEEFGLVALSLVLIVYAEAVADAGVAQALIYLPRSRAVARAAMLCSLVAGLLLVTVVVAGAPLIASFFGRPDMTPLVRLLAFSLLTASLGAVPEALLRRELLFHRVSVATVLRTLATGLVSVSLAFAGHGAWALAWGTVAGSATYAVAGWLLLDDRPDLALWRTTRQDVRAVLGYGLPVAGSSLLARLIFDIDYLVVGRIAGAVALGYYTLAFRLPELVILNVFYVLTAVVFPLYSRMRDDPARLREGYLFSVRVFSLYGVCAGAGLAVAAPLVVPVLFGDQWDAAVVPLVALSIYTALRAVGGGGATEIYKALGRPSVSVYLSLIRLAVLVPALLLAARWWGMEGVAWAQVATSFAFALLMQGVAAHVLELRWRDIAAAIAPALPTGAAIVVVGLLLSRLPLPPAAALAVVVAGGAATAVAVLSLVSPSLVRQLRDVVARRRTAPSPEPAAASRPE
ncbi:lipopolysaccharide biosynthesis protein [Modestobacter sp. I12A-02662]|uniref:lipopolysaccharide biosynthesis protein n=1 Tax=Modestobacter sp. I12A-02662 TaxID=1730496 RepID=UPI0034DF97D4